jgi:excisionase family DNA binding protein
MREATEIQFVPDGQNYKDIDRLIFAIQGRLGKLFMVEKPMHRKDAAVYLGIAVRTLDQLTSDGKIPFHRIDGISAKLYLPSELHEHIRKSKG